MRRSTLLLLLVLAACASPPPPQPAVVPAPDLGSGRVTATALNVRADASTDAEVLTLVRRGDELSLIEEHDGWYRVRLPSGESGWVSARYVSRGGRMPAPQPRRPGCPPDSDYAFEKSPMPSFSDRGAHGLVIVEANVNTNGVVTSTRVLSNNTGDETLAFLAEREIREARFIPPVRNCVRRPFLFTYKRAF
ncbi:MAG TPA: SH3 domain-containing protein [Thermoanaerobaculia bacterium]|nr:SH3 domain-containing protein [Thermoanaerobaculia bacterium]